MNVIIWRKAELIPESDEVVLVFPSMGIVNIGEIFLIGKLILFPPPSRVRFPDMRITYYRPPWQLEISFIGKSIGIKYKIISDIKRMRNLIESWLVTNLSDNGNKDGGR